MEETKLFYRDTWVEVNLNAIVENVLQLKHILPQDVDIMAVVKANGYGHGAVDVANTALEAGATSLGVALLDEALLLRKKGIHVPIIVLGYVSPKFAYLAAENNITLTVFQKDWVEKASEVFRDKNINLSCHIKIDTGMGRLGIRTMEEGKALSRSLRVCKNFHVEGIFTHFATADEVNNYYYEKQQTQFKMISDAFEREWGDIIPVKHCSNSAAALRFTDRSYNTVRFGISMYGLSPSEEIKHLLPFPLKEGFSLHSSVTHIKKLTKGEGISYGATYKAKSSEWIATVPIGYADGWIRKNGSGSVLVNGERAPIAGRICMDQMMVVLKNPVDIGTKVTLIGGQGDDYIPVDEVARRLETINYEIPCMISSRVPRVIKKDNQVLRINYELFQ